MEFEFTTEVVLEIVEVSQELSSVKKKKGDDIGDFEMIAAKGGVL